ncbi:MAG: GW dipeptide domain-containing protein [Ignavibacteriales bacterium]|nr:GW dipeptide domain-containing protein [Ignavibacteriales bacterium]
MRSKLLVILFSIIFIVTACKKEEEPKQTAVTKNSNIHQVVVEEAIQVSGYTYIRAKEGDKDYWMAATTMDVKKGETIYYEGSMEMNNFESKELKRKFDSILFVESVSKIPPVNTGNNIKASPQKPTIEKENISVTPAAGGITIAQLFSNPNSYAGKIVKIKGKVVKVNNGIMKTNWVHIQDGTSAGADFDLTVTTNDIVNLGDIITFEGSLVLNKDFGYGYSYKVLLENAKANKSL